MRKGYDNFISPIGKIGVAVDDIGVFKIELFEDEWIKYLELNQDLKQDKELCKEVITQLQEYFSGKRKEFSVPLKIEGTEFRKKVWNALRQIPYGQTKSYLEIAQLIGNPKAVRAIGQANRVNNLPIIIPCHRVIGKKGELVGFAGSRISTKKMLLEHEGIEIKG